MTAVRPRALVHAGHVLAAGVLLDEALLGAAELRRRALSLWSPGVRCFAVTGGLYLRFAAPRLLHAGEAPGLPVADLGGLLATAPLSAGERAALDPAPGAIVAVRAGAAAALVPGPEVDLSAWLDLAPELVRVEPLGRTPPPVAVPAAPNPDVRALLAVPPLAPEAALLARRLRAEGSGRRGASPVAAAGVAAGALAAGAAAAARWSWSALRRAFRRPAVTRAGAPGPGRGRAAALAAPAAPAAPGGLARALRRLRDRFLLATRIAHLAGMRQGAYLGKLLALFERGELDEALRRAIPLSDAGMPDGGLALGVPGLRNRLEITPSLASGGASIGLGPDLYAEMQRRYRQAFERLDAQGDAERAAFVLAELLRANEEAVSYLERKGKLRLAAELAEARGLPAGLVVRQWFLAGDHRRAVAAARARRAFADALGRLERSGHRDEAAALRLLWAEDLAASGLLELAVQTAKPLPQARALVLRWIDLAIAAGGTAGDALLGPLLELAPERFPEVRARVLEACADPGEDAALRRKAIARGLQAVPGTGAVRALARPVLRALLGDADGAALDAVEEGRLVGLAADPALRDDLPPPPPRGRAARAPTATLTRAFAADDAGARPALDAAVLPDGRALVALGEAGAALLARDGRTVARFDVPAHRLVVSDAGARALALARRGEATRVSRLSLDARTSAPVRDLHLDSFATTYDGAAWLAAADGAVLLLDALRDDLRALWRVGGLPGRPAALARTPDSLEFLVAGADLEGWRYQLPDPVLRARKRLAPGRDGEELIGMAAGGGRWYAALARGDGTALLRAAEGGGQAFLLSDVRELVAFTAGAEAVAAAVRTDAAVEIYVLDAALLATGGGSAAGLRARLSLRGAAAAALRVDGGRLTVADDRGRVIAVDLAAGRITHDLRV